MEVAVHLAQPVRAPLELPAPIEAAMLDRGKQRIHFWVIGIAVRDAEDAFAMAYDLADAAHIEIRVWPGETVDLNQVVAQGVRALEVGLQCFARGPQAQQIVGVLAPLDELREHEKLFRIAERLEPAACAHRPDIQGGDVPRQAAEGAVRPEHELRAVGHVLVAEGPGRTDSTTARRAAPPSS